VRLTLGPYLEAEIEDGRLEVGAQNKDGSEPQFFLLATLHADGYWRVHDGSEDSLRYGSARIITFNPKHFDPPEKK
jgi:hypothetical protein